MPIFPVDSNKYGLGVDLSLPVSIPSFNKKAVSGEFKSNLFYKITPGNWYKTFPFYFEIVDQSNSDIKIRFHLPIPPQNMTVQDLSTSEAHATVGGVVEETTHGVFNIVTLTGTTGLSASAPNLNTAPTSEPLVVEYRKYLDDLNNQTNPLSRLIGNVVSGLTNLAAGITGEAEGQLQYQNSGSAVSSAGAGTGIVVDDLSIGGKSNPKKGGFWSSVGKVFTTALDQFASGNAAQYKTPFANGYSWSHALRQMFLIYQREKSKNQNLALYFKDVKANTSYRCVVRSAQFTQNAKDPYLINYNISLKCWNISDPNLINPAPIDRFGENGDLKEVYTANITASITSVGNTIRNFRRPGGVAGAMVKNSTSSII